MSIVVANTVTMMEPNRDAKSADNALIHAFAAPTSSSRLSHAWLQAMSANTSAYELGMERKRAINRAYYHRNKSVRFTKAKLTLTILAQTAADHCKDREEEDCAECRKN